MKQLEYRAQFTRSLCLKDTLMNRFCLPVTMTINCTAFPMFVHTGEISWLKIQMLCALCSAATTAEGLSLTDASSQCLSARTRRTSRGKKTAFQKYHLKNGII